MYMLGQLYEQNAPMQDLTLAREWYQRAAQAGVKEAKEALAGMSM
jgi:TPR repeat protein